MSIYVPVMLILFVGSMQIYNVQSLFKCNNTGFLRSNDIFNTNVNTNLYTDDGIEVYENDDNYRSGYLKYNRQKITESSIQHSNQSNLLNEKQVVAYFDRNHLIDMWRH